MILPTFCAALAAWTCRSPGEASLAGARRARATGAARARRSLPERRSTLRAGTRASARRSSAAATRAAWSRRQTYELTVLGSTITARAYDTDADGALRLGRGRRAGAEPCVSACRRTTRSELVRGRRRARSAASDADRRVPARSDAGGRRRAAPPSADGDRERRAAAARDREAAERRRRRRDRQLDRARQRARAAPRAARRVTPRSSLGERARTSAQRVEVRVAAARARAPRARRRARSEVQRSGALAQQRPVVSRSMIVLTPGTAVS